MIYECRTTPIVRTKREKGPIDLQASRNQGCMIMNTGTAVRLWRPPYSLRGQTGPQICNSNPYYLGIHMHIANNSCYVASEVTVASEVVSSLGFELSDLKYICYHVTLTS